LIQTIISDIIAGGLGFLVAHYLSRAPELRPMRLSQLIFLPLAFIAVVSVSPDPSQGVAAAMSSFLIFIFIMVFIAAMIAPNIAFMFGSAFSNFIDPLDWTTEEEEVALRPINRLIDRDRYEDALDELEALLKTHKPSYEAFHVHAKLLNHFQRFDETVATLLRMIPLSKTTQQQLIAMELLDGLAGQQVSPAKPFEAGARPVRITHELVLFNVQSKCRTEHMVISPGQYGVSEIIVGRSRWLVLNDQPWGNAETCWESVRETQAVAPPKRGLLYQIARMHQTFVFGLKGKPFRQAKADSKAMHKEADEYIRQGNWAKALPFLEKAATDDPDSYEIAYRLLQAVHRTSTPFHARTVLDKVLQQSRWSEDEIRMLKELRG